MNTERLVQLLEGANPSLEDYSFFVSVVEKLPADLIWLVASKSTSLNYLLKKVVFAELQRKVQRQNIEEHLNEISTMLKVWVANAPG